MDLLRNRIQQAGIFPTGERLFGKEIRRETQRATFQNGSVGNMLVDRFSMD